MSVQTHTSIQELNQEEVTAQLTTQPQVVTDGVPPMNHAQVDVDRRRVEAHREEVSEESEVGRVTEGVHVPAVGVVLK